MERGIRVGMIAAVRAYVQEKITSLWEQFGFVSAHLVNIERDEDKLDVILEAMGFGVDYEDVGNVEKPDLDEFGNKSIKESVDPSLLPWASHKFDWGV